MPIQTKHGKAAFFYRTIGFLIGTVGLVMHLLADRVVDTGFMVKHQLAYFTVQTNIFILLMFGILTIQVLLRHEKEKDWQQVSADPRIQLPLTLYITVTMLGYWGMLAPTTGLPPQPYLFCSTLILHTITPLLAIGDMVLFGTHGKVSWHEVGGWLWYPAVYLVLAMVFSQSLREPYYSFRLGERTVELMYPYPFLDPAVVGLWGVVGVVAGLVALFILLGLLFVFLDHKLAR